MGTQRRIETEEAKLRRNARQHFAEPGGTHDRLVGFLGKILPAGVGILTALMVITPLSPRGEVSFLLDRNKVAVIHERLRIDNALYRGQDNLARPFSVTAADAVQQSSEEGLVRMKDLVARILLPDGPTKITAVDGIYNINSETITVPTDMQLTAADGYHLTASGVSLDLNSKRITGEGKVEGLAPAGAFSADRIVADIAARTIVLEGNSRLRMVPGQMRVP